MSSISLDFPLDCEIADIGTEKYIQVAIFRLYKSVWREDVMATDLNFTAVDLNPTSWMPKRGTQFKL